jgi:hypothetical protein
MQLGQCVVRDLGRNTFVHVTYSGKNKMSKKKIKNKKKKKYFVKQENFSKFVTFYA